MGFPKANVKISDDHHQWCVARWIRLDRDGDGDLAREELNTETFFDLIREVMGSSADDHIHIKINVAQFVKWFQNRADSNNDKRLSFDEFEIITDVIKTAPSMHDRSARRMWAEAAFALFDINGDNMIDREEFCQLYAFFVGYRPKEADLEKAWITLDKKGNQQVNRRTFIDWAMTYQLVKGEAHFVGLPKKLPPSYQDLDEPLPTLTHPIPPLLDIAQATVHDRRNIGVQFPTPKDRPTTAPFVTKSSDDAGLSKRPSTSPDPGARRSASAHGGGKLSYSKIALGIHYRINKPAGESVHTVPWNYNHYLVDPYNHLKHQNARCYFSRPQTEDELERYCLSTPVLRTIGLKLVRTRSRSPPSSPKNKRKVKKEAE